MKSSLFLPLYCSALLLFCYSSDCFAHKPSLQQSQQVIQEASLITVECYANFLGAAPDSDQYYDAATMQDQINCIEEGDQMIYSIVDGQENQAMLGLTDLEIKCYWRWEETSQTTTTPLMMFGSEKKEDKQKTIDLSEAQRQRQRDATSGSTASSSSYGRGSSMPKITERTPLLDKGNSSSPALKQAASKKTAAQSAEKNSTQASIANASIIARAELPFNFLKRTQNKDRVPSSFGTAEERQSLLRSSTAASTISHGAISTSQVASPQRQETRTAFINTFLKENVATRFITRAEDVHSIDELINRTPRISSRHEKDQPPFAGEALQILLFPQRIAAHLFPVSLGDRFQRDSNNLRYEQSHMRSKLPLCTQPTDGSQIPNFLTETERWIESQKEITNLSFHFLDRIIEIQESKMSQVHALSPSLFNALQSAWLNRVNDFLEIHRKVKKAEALLPAVAKLPDSSHLTTSIEKMRSTSDRDLQLFLIEGKKYIYLCEKTFFQRIADHNSRLNILQLSLTMKEQLEGLQKIALKNDQVLFRQYNFFTRAENGDLKILDTPAHQSAIRAAEEARDEAYSSYQCPTFNRLIFSEPMISISVPEIIIQSLGHITHLIELARFINSDDPY